MRALVLSLVDTYGTATVWGTGRAVQPPRCELPCAWSPSSHLGGFTVRVPASDVPSYRVSWHHAGAAWAGELPTWARAEPACGRIGAPEGPPPEAVPTCRLGGGASLVSGAAGGSCALGSGRRSRQQPRASLLAKSVGCLTVWSAGRLQRRQLLRHSLGRRVLGGLTFGRSVDEEGVKESARGGPCTVLAPEGPGHRERGMARSVSREPGLVLG
eukprot:scaffold40631_cov71-Phaeocystis_antarctica.AAC.1